MAADFEAVLARKERGWEVRLREMYAQISKEKEDFKLQVKAYIILSQQVTFGQSMGRTLKG